MVSRRLLLTAPLVWLAGCGGGGGDSGAAAAPVAAPAPPAPAPPAPAPPAPAPAPPPPPSSGRYLVTITSAQLESAAGLTGQATIRRARLLLDGEVIADRTYGSPTATALFGTFLDIPRSAGRHVLAFQLVEQSVPSSTYAINPQGFLFIRDTQSAATQVEVLTAANGQPLTAVLQAGEALSFSFDIP